MKKNIVIDGVETKYEVTNEGKVINKISGKEIKVNGEGAVQLSINGKNKGRRVAKLVAEAFIPNPDPSIYLYVTNIDGDKTNNQISNLKWITASENSSHVWENRRKNGTNPHTGRKKSENIVEKPEKFKINENEKRVYIDGEETPYVITKEGILRNLKTGNILKGSLQGTYPYVNLRWNGKQKNKAFHRLVAETWIPNPENLPIVDHIDGDRLNYHVDNLRWVTEQENSNNVHKDKAPIKIDTTPTLSEEELQKEEWRYNETTHYMISNMGRVKGKNGEILQGTLLDCGYKSFQKHESRNKILGHILVWETFIGEKPVDMVINHINGNKHDNRLSNLELVTQKENMQKAAKETNAWNFRKVVEIDDKGNILREFANASDAARAIGIAPSSMRNSIRRNGKCYNGLKYRYVEN